MRRARMKVPVDRAVGFYHCVSRVVDRQWIFEPGVKQEFLRLMREFESFCEVRVLTYCLMSNHFHILVAVPKPPETKPTAEQVLEKLARLTGHQDVGAAWQQLELFRQRGDVTGEAQWLARYPNVRVTVEGHADERGTRDYNLALSERRATAARNFLASQGVDPARISVMPYGKERPVALGSDEASWAQNRRAVTVTINR